MPETPQNVCTCPVSTLLYLLYIPFNKIHPGALYLPPPPPLPISFPPVPAPPLPYPTLPYPPPVTKTPFRNVFHLVTPDSIMEIYKRSISMELQPKDMLTGEAVLALTSKAETVA